MTARRLGAREWLVLSRLPGLGAARLAELAATVKAWPDGWLALLPREAATSLRLWLDHPGRSPLSDEIARAEAWLAEAPDRHLLHPGHPHWPTLLTEIPDPPSTRPPPASPRPPSLADPAHRDPRPTAAAVGLG